MTAQFPVIINVRDRVEALRDLVSWLERAGQQDIWLCDNASTYEPMREFLASTPHRVVRNEINLGHRAMVEWIGHTTRVRSSLHHHRSRCSAER
jgi:hypothetical protein